MYLCFDLLLLLRAEDTDTWGDRESEKPRSSTLRIMFWKVKDNNKIYDTSSEIRNRTKTAESLLYLVVKKSEGKMNCKDWDGR